MSTMPASASTGVWRGRRRRCGGPSPIGRWCATTPTTSCPAASRCRSRCWTMSSRGSCCRASITATRRACMPSTCRADSPNSSSLRRRPRRCASRSHPARRPATTPSRPPEMAARPRVGYLGPEGTFSEEAVLGSVAAGAVEPVPLGTIYETVVALQNGDVEWAVVPIENSLDGSISVTLDLLAGEASDVEIVGEALLRVRHSLIAGEALALEQIETVLTHPQVPGQCASFLRRELAHAQILPASSTAEAVRMVSGDRALKDG